MGVKDMDQKIKIKTKMKDLSLNDQPLSVALLFSDLEKVHLLTSHLKKLNIVPHFYEDLKSFWTGTLEKIPSLCIVDVKKMSEGEFYLGEHPGVIAEELPLVFYYEQKHKALLLSTYNFYHLGTLCGGEDLEGQLKSLFLRLKKVWSLEKDCADLRLQSFGEKSERDLLIKKLDEKLEINRYQKMANQLFFEFEKASAHGDFFGSLSKIFQNVPEIVAFSYVELSLDGQKILSPLSDMPKYKALPFFRTQKICHEGIEELEQNISHQMAEGLLKGPFVALYLKGAGRYPDKILYIKTENADFFQEFDWNLLESFLNGLYARSELALKIISKKDKVFESPFSIMGYLDQALYGAAETIDGARNATAINIQEARLVEVNLSLLVDSIIKRVHNRFYWQRFERDFIQKLKVSTRVKFEAFSIDVRRMSFIVEGRQLDLFFEDLKSFSKRFSYFMYFENLEEVLTEYLTPEVSMTPISSYAYLTKKLAPDESKVQNANVNVSANVNATKSFIKTDRTRAHEV